MGDPPPEETLSGVGGGSVRLLASGTLGIWVSEGGGGQPSIERLRQHELVVRSALRSATPLPLRFGTLFRTESDALAALTQREEDFTEALGRVADHVEMGIRVALVGDIVTIPDSEDPHLPAATTGTAYLQRRREELKREARMHEYATGLLTELELELRDLDVLSVINVAPQANYLGTLAHLVHRAKVRPYRDRVERLQERRRDLRLVASGPWAPYSFVR